MQHVLPNNFVRVRYYGLMHPAYSEEIKKIKNSAGTGAISERHSSRDSDFPFPNCPTCKKPFLITMLIFPSYIVQRANNKEKNTSKFYNTNTEIQMNTG